MDLSLPQQLLELPAVGVAVVVVVLAGLVLSLRGSGESPLRGRHVLVSGASQGLGLALARQLVLDHGCRVSLLARREEVLRGIATELGVERVCVCAGDVTDDESVQRALAVAREKFGEVDCFIACAGYAIMGFFHQMPLDDFKKEMDLNYLGAVIPLRHLSAAWTKNATACRESGKPVPTTRVLFVSSAVGMTSFVGYSAYSPTKFALRGLAESLRNEFLPYGIKVHIAYPGNIDTPGYAEENKTKPKPTLAIEEAFGPEPADKVARAVLNGVRLEQFNIYADDLGSILLGRLNGGTAPRNTPLLDIVVSPILILFSFAFRFYVDFMVKRHHQQ